MLLGPRPSPLQTRSLCGLQDCNTLTVFQANPQKKRNCPRAGTSCCCTLCRSRGPLSPPWLCREGGQAEPAGPPAPAEAPPPFLLITDSLPPSTTINRQDFSPQRPCAHTEENRSEHTALLPLFPLIHSTNATASVLWPRPHLWALSLMLTFIAFATLFRSSEVCTACSWTSPYINIQLHDFFLPLG